MLNTDLLTIFIISLSYVILNMLAYIYIVSL